jgi:hypothetical protein
MENLHKSGRPVQITTSLDQQYKGAGSSILEAADDE